tara:strand:+ start:10983 stop:11342 length:360 start_codon:yes stop_codon:yes gene_type:complete
MCLDVSINETVNMKMGFGEDPKTFYKVYAFSFEKASPHKLISLFLGHPLVFFEDGFVVSDRESIEFTEQENKSYDIYHGIHVYRKKYDAEKESRRLVNQKILTTVIIEVSGYPEDFVAA